ncbi:molybdopterin-dependent oxidoreductase [Natroniella sulfidigena]|uniref:molybdopterin-dependent oxidoreductase n=1 Tax=Natroniella sulfidigena TaxID=723921 RepID=UPI00200AB3BE|nr:molybdopterin-dependent oxidoreductase [Natroniella sulfidigena]MCK8818223.1 molybdopterin-dependent oxidoreductase [Natroniella sulfidigena]
MNLTRRNFLKVAAAGAVMTAAGCSPKDEEVAEVNEDGEQEVEQWTKAVCRFCGVGCGCEVGVIDNKIVAVKGIEDNPVNNGMLCMKGLALPEVMNDREERLMKPQIRKNGELVETDWDTALDLVADKFKESIAKHGKDSVAFYGSAQNYIQEGYIASKLMKAGIGTNNIECNARLCMASAVTGFYGTFGMDEPMGVYGDIDYADQFFLIGSNMAENHPVLFVRLTQRKSSESDVRVIVADPRKTRTHTMSDIDLFLKCGSDVALLNSMAYVIIDEDLVDHEFVDNYTKFKKGKGLEGEISFEEFKKSLNDYAPKKAAEITGLTAEEIREAARMFADPDKKTTTFWCMGVNQQVQGTKTNNLIYNLHLLTGKIGEPGSTPFSLTGQPSACGTAREVGYFTHRLPNGRNVSNFEDRKEAAEIWGVDVDKIPAEPTYHTVAMFDAMAEGEIKVLWNMVTNPAQSMPNLNRVNEGLEKAFVIVSDVFPTETIEYADVVLPSSLWVEEEGMFGNGERRTQFLEKAIDSPESVRSDLWQLLEIAKRLGYGDLFSYGDHPEKEIFNEYREFTLGTGYDLGRYEDYVAAKGRGLLWPVIDGQETVRRFIAEDDPYVDEGIEFYGNEHGKANIVAEGYTGPAELPDEEYPYFLTTGRVIEHWHTGSMTMRAEELREEMPEAYVELHPEDADKLNVTDDDLVKLTSRRGEIELKVRVGGRGEPQPGLLFVPFFDREKLINLLVIDEYDPVSKEPEFKIGAVKIEKL